MLRIDVNRDLIQVAVVCVSILQYPFMNLFANTFNNLL